MTRCTRISVVGGTFVAAVAIAVTPLHSQEPSSVDADDLAGLVRSDGGVEAGVWVIAETDDLDTRFRKIVVTDDEGRFVVPDLPDGTQNLHRKIASALIKLRAEDFQHAGLRSGHLATHKPRQSAIFDRGQRIDVHVELGQALTDSVVLHRRLAVQFHPFRQFPQSPDRSFELGIEQAAALVGEEPLGERPPFVLVADAVGNRDANIGEKRLIELGFVRHLPE